MRRGSPKNRILDFWIGIPLLNLLATFRLRKARWPRTICKVGVLCSPALGDTLLFSSVLQDLRRHFDSAAAAEPAKPVEIIHFVMQPNLAAAEIIPGADRRVLIELTKPSRTIRQLRAERLDVLLDFSSWQRLTAFYSLTSGARFTAGFRTAGQYRGRGYDLAAEHRDDRHEVENFRAVLHELDLPTGAPPAIVPLDPVLSLIAMQSDMVVFHLWASGQRSHLREWPEDRWLALAARLAGPETVFMITGGPADLDRSKPFVARLRAAGFKAETFISPDGFRSLTSLLLRRARVVISVNTGVMHLAAIAGAPTVSINGPNRNGRWGPIGPRALGVEAPGEGCGYLHLGFNFDGQATDCMERITVDHIAAAAEYVQTLPEPLDIRQERLEREAADAEYARSAARIAGPVTGRGTGA